MKLYFKSYAETVVNKIHVYTKELISPQSTDMYKSIYNIEHLVTILRLDERQIRVHSDRHADASIISHYYEMYGSYQIYIMNSQFNTSNTPKLLNDYA